MQPNEIRESIRFYESAPGKKYTDRDFALATAELAGVKYENPVFSKEELAAISQFLKSSAGSKLITKGVVMTPKLFEKAQPLTDAIVVQCRDAIFKS